MRQLINVEEHYICPSVNKKMFDYLTAHTLIDLEDNYHQLNIGPNMARLNRDFSATLSDIGEKRLAFMDTNGIKRQIVSYDNVSPQNLPAEIGVDLCREANDYAASLVKAHPDRFSVFSVLPLGDPAAAAAELERTVKDKGFVGAMLTGTYNGRFLDSPEFFPVFEKAASLKVPIYLHPAEIHPEIARIYFSNEQWDAKVSALFSTYAFAWHAEAGITAIRLMLSGIFDKLPDLQIISGHWGEVTGLWVSSRLSKILTPSSTGLKKTIAEYYRDHVYVSPSGMFDRYQFEELRDLVGIDRILWSEDYPQLQVSETRRFLDSFPMTEGEKDKVAYLNAERLLGLR